MTTQTGTAEDRAIVITRVIKAPRKLVFAAWTEPAHLAKWFKPKGFTTPVCELDVRPGGRWFLGHRAPDGAEYPFKGAYREVVPVERLVYTDEWEMEGQQHEALVTVTFEEQGEHTLLTIQTVFESTPMRDGAVEQGFATGWSEFLDGMEEHLASV